MDGLGVAGELGAHLAHPVAQADHPVEVLVREHVEVLRLVTGQVDAVLVSHHPNRVGMQWPWIAPGAVRLDEPSGSNPRQRLGHLGSSAVAGAQEQHPHRIGCVVPGGGRDETKAGVEFAARGRHPATDAGQIDRVVRVAAIG